MITYTSKKQISDSHIRRLYDAVGWKSYTEKVADLQTLLNHSQLVYSAWDGEKLVGLIRTVGDGLSIQYIQDILVLPTYQKSGIGNQLLTHVFEQSKHIRQLVLMTDGSEFNQYVLDWYEAQGLLPFEKVDMKGFLHFNL